MFLGLWQGVDDLVGTSVVEAFAGLVLDGAGVGAEAIDVLAEAGVLGGELFDFEGESFVVGAFLLPAGEAVAAGDGVPAEEQGEGNGSYGAEAAAVGQVGCCDALEEGRFLWVWHV